MHHSDVIMGAMASEITGVSIVYSNGCSGADQRKHQSFASLAFVRGPVTNEFPAQRANNVENISIWWLHRVDGLLWVDIWKDINLRFLALNSRPFPTEMSINGLASFCLLLVYRTGLRIAYDYSTWHVYIFPRRPKSTIYYIDCQQYMYLSNKVKPVKIQSLPVRVSDEDICQAN